LKVLLIFCCNPSGWAQKWQRQPTERLASTGIGKQNPVFGSISMQNVKIWAKCGQIRGFHRLLLAPLLIFCCILSGWAKKWPRASSCSLISTEIGDKCTEMLRICL
jgi:hypothetical protein